MSLEKKVLEQVVKDKKKMGGDLAYWMDSRKFLKELHDVADKIRERRNKIQKVIDEEVAFRRSTAFHAYSGAGRRGFSEIEMDKFQTIVKELDLVLGLLVEEKKET